MPAKTLARLCCAAMPTSTPVRAPPTTRWGTAAVKQGQGEGGGGRPPRQDHGEADDPRVRRPDRRLQDVAGLVAEPERRDAPEQEERDGRAVFQDPVAGLAQRAEPRGGLGLTRQGQQIRGAASLDRYGGRDDGEPPLQHVTPRPGAGPDLGDVLAGRLELGPFLKIHVPTLPRHTTPPAA